MLLSSEKQAAASRHKTPQTRIASQAESPARKPATWAAITKEDVARVIPALVATTVRRVSTLFRGKLFTPNQQLR